jgi:hypothetical protein
MDDDREAEGTAICIDRMPNSEAQGVLVITNDIDIDIDIVVDSKKAGNPLQEWNEEQSLTVVSQS